MTRETKFNLIFIVVLIILVAPGGYKLFQKKLQPGARYMSRPDSMPTELAYIDEASLDPRLKRVVPPLTANWVRESAEARWKPADAVRPSWHRGLISQQRGAEVLVSEQSPGSVRMGLLIWQSAGVRAVEKLQATWNHQPGVLESSEILAVPETVRKELRDLGMTRPASQVAWAVVRFPAGAEISEAADLQLQWPSGVGEKFFVDQLPVHPAEFKSPARSTGDSEK